MNTVRAGIAAWRNWNLKPTDIDGWNWHDSRLARYELFESYYANIVYGDIDRFAVTYKARNKLYQHIRPIYNPCRRLVDLYVAKVYGGTLDMRKLASGAIPLQFPDEVNADALTEAIRQIWKWSNWGAAKSLYVRNGAMFGDTVIKIVDDRQRQKVRMEVVHPGKVKSVELDAVGNVQKIEFEYMYTEENPETGNIKEYTYCERIDKNKFATYRNGEPFAYFNDQAGNPLTEWTNDYGFVPVVLAKHADIGLTFGASAFYGSLRKIDELNDVASLLNDQIRKSINVMWYFAGVGGPEQLDTRGNTKNTNASAVAANGGVAPDRKDALPAIYGPENSQPHPMIAPLDVTSALADINSMMAEIERDMPELSLHRLREGGGDLTAPGVRAGFSDASDRIVEARGNYDSPQVRAMQMALTIGGMMNYEGFRPFSRNSYDRGDLEFAIAERPVIEDELSKGEKVDKLIQTGAPSSAIWREMGYSQDTVDQWEKEQADSQAAQEQMIAGQISRLAKGGQQQGQAVPQLEQGNINNA